jgi:glycosyltransferase involved in cell wall biosynthesis
VKPLSLIHVVNVDGLGGTGATAFRLARLLAARGHSVLFCVRPGSIWIEPAQQANLEVSTEMSLGPGFRPAGFLTDLARLRRLVRERRAQIVHVHRSAEYWRAALALGGRRDGTPGRPRLVRSRGVVTPIAPHAVNRWLHNRRTDLVICTAQSIHDMYRSLPGFDFGKVRLLHDGVDLEEFRPDAEARARTRRELGVPEAAPLVAVVARFDPVKGHRYLLEAAPLILARHPQARFLLAGRKFKGKLAGEIQERVRAAGLEKSFLFSARREDVPGLLAAADLFALCSTGSEGSSRGTLEAMAAALPAVTTSVGCLPDLVVEGQTGFLVPPGDAEALAARLSALLADPELRARMGRAGRERAEAEFDERRVAEKLEALYREILGEGVP